MNVVVIEVDVVVVGVLVDVVVVVVVVVAILSCSWSYVQYPCQSSRIVVVVFVGDFVVVDWVLVDSASSAPYPRPQAKH